MEPGVFDLTCIIIMAIMMERATRSADLREAIVGNFTASLFLYGMVKIIGLMCFEGFHFLATYKAQYIHHIISGGISFSIWAGLLTYAMQKRIRIEQREL